VNSTSVLLNLISRMVLDRPLIRPLVKNGRSNRLPRRGPLHLPRYLSSRKEINSLLEEGRRLVLFLSDVSPCSIGINRGASHIAYPLLERLHEILIFIMVMRELEAEAVTS
jgi:hypothetical protein